MDWSTTTGAVAVRAEKEGAKGAPRAFGTNKCTVAQLVMIRDLLWAHYFELNRIFTYYSCHDTATTGSIYAITKIGYTQLCRDAGLLQNADGEDDAGLIKIVDLTWVAVNDSLIAKKQEYNAKAKLIRWELIEWAVRMAFERYAVEGRSLTGEELVAAVQSFLEREIAKAAKVTYSTFGDVDKFRNAECYHVECDDVLRMHEHTLRALFDSYAFGSGDVHNKLNAVNAIVYEEYLELMDHLYGWQQELGDRKVAQCFAWSRMLVIDEHSVGGRAKFLRLVFEDFLEVIVRISTFKALPSDAELKKNGHTDCGEYLKTLRAENTPEAYEDWVSDAKRAKEWGECDPTPRRLHHMITLIVSMVKAEVVNVKKAGTKAILKSGSCDALTREEVDIYRKRGGSRPQKQAGSEPGSPTGAAPTLTRRNTSKKDVTAVPAVEAAPAYHSDAPSPAVAIRAKRQADLLKGVLADDEKRRGAAPTAAVKSAPQLEAPPIVFA